MKGILPSYKTKYSLPSTSDKYLVHCILLALIGVKSVFIPRPMDIHCSMGSSCIVCWSVCLNRHIHLLRGSGIRALDELLDTWINKIIEIIRANDIIGVIDIKNRFSRIHRMAKILVRLTRPSQYKDLHLNSDSDSNLNFNSPLLRNMRFLVQLCDSGFSEFCPIAKEILMKELIDSHEEMIDIFRIFDTNLHAIVDQCIRYTLLYTLGLDRNKSNKYDINIVSDNAGLMRDNPLLLFPLDIPSVDLISQKIINKWVLMKTFNINNNCINNISIDKTEVIDFNKNNNEVMKGVYYMRTPYHKKESSIFIETRDQISMSESDSLSLNKNKNKKCNTFIPVSLQISRLVDDYGVWLSLLNNELFLRSGFLEEAKRTVEIIKSFTSFSLRMTRDMMIFPGVKEKDNNNNNNINNNKSFPDFIYEFLKSRIIKFSIVIKIPKLIFQLFGKSFEMILEKLQIVFSLSLIASHIVSHRLQFNRKFCSKINILIKELCINNKILLNSYRVYVLINSITKYFGRLVNYFEQRTQDIFYSSIKYFNYNINNEYEVKEVDNNNNINYVYSNSKNICSTLRNEMKKILNSLDLCISYKGEIINDTIWNILCTVVSYKDEYSQSFLEYVNEYNKNKNGIEDWNYYKTKNNYLFNYSQDEEIDKYFIKLDSQRTILQKEVEGLKSKTKTNHIEKENANSNIMHCIELLLLDIDFNGYYNTNDY